jgi:bifunctional ADP-heptose synthase (sugar kinase/adenylyltransferase)
MKNILVIGETCEDIFNYGKITRLSPEAPVPVFIQTYSEKNLGMAKNVEENVHNICWWFKHISALTKDIEYKIDSILSVSENTKTRYVCEKTNHYLLRIDDGDLTHNRFALTKTNLRLIKNADTIIISDYNKGFLNEEDILSIHKHRKKDSLLLIDSKKILSKEVMEVVTWIKMNKPEFEEREKVLLEYYGKTIITLGGDGAMFRDKVFETKFHKVRDVSGAGDTFLAALSVSLTFGFKISTSITDANKFASRVVLNRGVSTVQIKKDV